MSDCITTIDLCVGQHNSDGFDFYLIDATTNENNTTKEKIKDHFDKLVFAVKRSERDPDSAILFYKTYTITDPNLEELPVAITAQETGLPAGNYFHEVKGFKPSSNYAKTVAMGKFEVQETVIDSTDGSGFES